MKPRRNIMRESNTIRWTYEDYLQLPDDGTRCEIIEGERLMTPAPWLRHQRVSLRLTTVLHLFVEANDLGVLYEAPADVILADDTVVQPDIFVVLKDHQTRLRDRGVFGAPDLVVEVLSPSTENRDRVRKMRIYARHGVREYWIIDPIDPRIEVYVLEGKTFIKKAEHTSGEVRSLVVLTGFSAKFADIFKP